MLTAHEHSSGTIKQNQRHLRTAPFHCDGLGRWPPTAQTSLQTSPCDAIADWRERGWRVAPASPVCLNIELSCWKLAFKLAPLLSRQRRTLNKPNLYFVFMIPLSALKGKAYSILTPECTDFSVCIHRQNKMCFLLGN